MCHPRRHPRLLQQAVATELCRLTLMNQMNSCKYGCNIPTLNMPEDASNTGYIYIYIVVFGHNQLAEMELRPLKLWVRRYHMKSHWRQRLLLTYPHSSKTTSPFGTQVEALTLTVVGPSCRRRCPQLFYNTSFSPLRPPVSFVDRFPGKEPQKMSHSSSG